MTTVNLMDKFKYEKNEINSINLMGQSVFEGIWIRPYFREYDNIGREMDESKTFRSKDFNQRDYIWVGHVDELSIKYNKEEKEITFDSTDEKVYMDGPETFEMSFSLGHKFRKKIAALNSGGNLLKSEPQDLSGSIYKSTLGEEDIHTLTILEGVEVFENIGFNYTIDGDNFEFTLVNSLVDLKTGEAFFNISNNTLSFKLDNSANKDIEIFGQEGMMGYTYVVSYGGDTKIKQAFNVVVLGQKEKDLNYIEVYKAYISGGDGVVITNSKDKQTLPITLKGSIDITRPKGDQLFKVLDTFDNSLKI